MDQEQGDVVSPAAHQSPFQRWQAGRRQRRAELRNDREREGGLAANLGLAAEIMLDRLDDGEGLVVPVAATDDGPRRWLYAERIESSHYGEGISYLLADTDRDARSLLKEPTVGALYPDYEEATFRLNALTAEEAIAVRDASTASKAAIDPEWLRCAVRNWFERASTVVPT